MEQFISRQQILEKTLAAINAKNVDAATEAMISCREDLGGDLMAALPSDSPARQVLALVFVKAKDYRRAAEVYEAAGSFLKAAGFYEYCQDYLHAAELYLKIEEDNLAAEAFEKAGDFHRAAEIFLKLKDGERAAHDYALSKEHFQAGKSYCQAKKFKPALQQFQLVKPEDPQYIDAMLNMAQILHRGRHSDLARQKLTNTIKGKESDPRLLPLQYELAAILEDEKKIKAALVVFSRIVKVDPDFRDAAARFKALKEQVPTEDVAAKKTEEAELPEAAEEEQVFSIMDGFQFVKDTPLFETLTLEETKVIFDICEVRQVPKGDPVIEQGIPGWGLFIVKSGSLLIQLEERGQLKDLTTLPTGSYVGEMSLFDVSLTSAKVVAAETCELLAINRKRFNDLLNSHPNIKLKVLSVFVKILSERLRKTTAELARLKK